MLCIVSALGMRAQTWTGNDVAAGDFYLYNIGTGKWLSSGNSWGTQATLIEAGGFCSTLELSDGKYAIKNTETRTNNKAAGPGYLGNNGFMDGESATYFTFTEVTGRGDGVKAYYIQDGTNNLAYSGSGTVVAFAAETGDNAQWVLVTKADRLAAMANATEANPVDATFLLKNPEFGRYKLPAYDAAWTFTFPGETNKNNAGDNTNFCVESYHAAFDFAQTVADAPKGYYAVRGQAFYRQDGSNNTDLPYFYVGSTKVNFPAKTGSEGSMTAASTSFLSGNYQTAWSDKATYTGGGLKVGTHLDNNTALWCIWDNIQIQYYGPIDLSAFATALADAVAAAEATDGTIPTAAYNAIAAVVTEYNKSYDNEDDYSAAITAINNAVSTYASAAIVAAYANYNNVKAAVLAVDGSIDVTAADALANDGTDANLDDAVAAVRTALKTYLSTTDKTNVPLTAALLVNPSFETGNFTGWTNNNMALQTNTSFGKDGNVYCEKWVPNGTFGVSQTITAMPAGVYQVTAKAKARGVTSAKLSAGGIEKAITIADSESDYVVEFAIDDNSDITIAFEGVGTGAGSSWLVVDNFRLMLVSAGLPEVTAVTGKMNAEVESAQTAAITAYNSDKTVANYNAAAAAISAAETSKAAYAVAATALADANALKDAHNFASSAAITTFADAIAAVQTKYDNGTLTNDEANAGGNLGMIATGWHAGNNTPAAVYLRDGFALGDFAADPALHVNTWSTEGATDGSNFSVPFYESWTADANSLPESTVTGTISGLPNGLYSISAWVRVAAKTGVNATDAAGITMDVNGGSAVDVTEGTQIGTTQRSIETYVAEGLVKDGKLTLNFNIAANANISWLAFKNVKYTKVRDLTPAEEAPATAEDYAALNAAIANAEAKTLGFDEGDYAPYNNITVLAALAAAKAINQEGDNAHEDVVAATNAIADSEWNANVEEVNAVYDGTFAAATNNGAPKGWTMSNNTLGGALHSRAFVGDTRLSEFNGTNSGLFLRFDGTNSNRGSLYYYGNTENYTMPLKKDVTYYAKVDFTNWGTTNSKPLRMYVSGPDGFTATGLTVNSTKNADTGSDTPDQILFVFTPNVAGNYVINFQCPGSDDNKHNVVISNVEVKRVPTLALSEDVAWTPAAYPAANVTLARTIAADKWSTFVVPFDIDNATLKAQFGDDVQVSEFSTDVKTGVTFTPMAEPAITANKPVLVRVSSAKSDFSFDDVTIVAGTPTISENGVNFVGNYDGQITIPNTLDTYYVNSNTLKKSNGNQKLKGFRAYFTVDADSPVKAFFEDGINLDVTDAINALETADTKNALIYNLAGQRLQKMQRGINIVNGKKVLVK